MIGVIMFVVTLCLLLVGLPVAFTFAALSVFFGLLSGVIESLNNGGSFMEGIDIGVKMFAFMPYRVYAIVQNKILMAVPLFIFVGFVLQKTNIAYKLLEAISHLFGNLRGGLAIGVMIIGTLLAASIGVVGATVIAMGLMALPIMLKYNYNKSLACGVICASGTLGQIVPPSIVLIILSDVFQISVGDTFKYAIIPSMVLIAAYIIYIILLSVFDKKAAPAAVMYDSDNERKGYIKAALLNIIPPTLLIFVVLGSIFYGIATPTESAALGCVGALILSAFYRQFSFKLILDSALETLSKTSMVFGILIGATAFSMVFSYTGGEEVVQHLMTNLPGGAWGFIILTMIAIFIFGFFIDFVEISYIIIPIILPAMMLLGINPIWFSILIAMNLQTSFLSPPFGFSLFYLKGVVPQGIQTTHIYKGVMPFILIQVLVLALLIVFPQFFGFSPFIK